MAGVPDWIPPVQAAGVKVKVIPTESFFPHMAQAHRRVRRHHQQKPEMVRKFVKAALRGMKDIMDDPEKESANSSPSCRMEGQGGRREVRLRHVRQVGLSGPEGAGRDERRPVSANCQDFYLAKGFIQKATPVNELYTNEFVT